MVYTVTALKSGPVHIVALGWALTATFVLLYVLCFLAAVIFPNASLTHAWLGLYSTAPIGSVRGLVEGIIWNVVFVMFPAEPMTMWPISTRVNKPENDDASLLDPAA